MDLIPVCLRVTFCNIKLLVSVSPFKAILDLKKEVSRVYHLHYPQKTLVILRYRHIAQSPTGCYREECKYVQDSSGYLVCDDYQVGLVFSNHDSVFALTAAQPLDKYSDQWRSSDSSAKPLGADEQQCVISRQSHAELVSNKNTSKVTSTPVLVERRKHLDEEESDEASETDCSNELIPQVLEGNQLTHVPKPSVDAKQVNSPNVTSKNLQDKKELSKKESTGIFTDSSLSDSDSETIATKTVTPNRGGGKTVGDESKLTPKKKTRRTVQEQNIVTSTGSGDKTKDSVDTRKSLGQKFQLAIDTINTPPATVSKKLRMKRKHPSDDAQGTSSEKKAKKKISKKELELANTSSQSMILDNAKLWTE